MKKSQKVYIGQTNQNGQVVTRAQHSRLSVELRNLYMEREAYRTNRWLDANTNKSIKDAPKHIRG